MAKSMMYCRRNRSAFLVVFVLSCVALLCAIGAGSVSGSGTEAPPAEAAPIQDKRLDVRLRSFAGNVNGRLRVEPTVSGGRVRITVMNLPSPQTLTPNARTYVVWAVGNGRVVRLGELITDERGHGGLEFNQPESLDRYSVIVTAETSSQAMGLMGALVLWTKAYEVAPRFAAPKDNTRDDTAKNTKADKNEKTDKSATASMEPKERAKPKERTSQRQTGDFFSEINDALTASGGGRKIELEGTEMAPGARGLARVTARNLDAFVRARFRQVPAPEAISANTYVMWATMPDNRIVYMGSLPTEVNNSDVYVRTSGFNSDDFSLFITAERQRPVIKPSEHRALTPIEGKLASK